MKQISIFVSVGDKASELKQCLEALSVPGVRVTIKRQTQVTDIWTPNGAIVAPFTGTMADVLEYLEERCRAATGYPNSAHRCKFVMPTTVEIVK